MIRSRAQLNKDWEKPSKYFLNLEKQNYINKSIPTLSVNNTLITNSKEILKQQQSFYSHLYASKGTKNLLSGNFSNYIENMTKLSDIKREQLDLPYTWLDEERPSILSTP